MYKLIASDLDGTLLQNGAQKLDESVFHLIRCLKQKGILFVAASGRQYQNMRRLFAPVWKDIIFICENGALIMYQDEVLSATEIDRTLGMALMEDIRSRSGCEVMLSGQNTCYFEPNAPVFVERMLYGTRNTITVVDDICSVDEPFLKISAYEEAGIIANSGAYFQQKWAEKINVAVAGYEWMDFTVADKGSALELVRQRFGLAQEQLMAFGDNYNDAPMLRQVGRAYVMDNAHQELKAMTRYHTDRVETILMQLLNDTLN